MSTKKQTKVEVTTTEVRELLTDEQIAKIVEDRYAIAGGSKFAVFRQMFVDGYQVKEVFKMLSGKEHFETLIYQHVRNEHVRWMKKQG